MWDDELTFRVDGTGTVPVLVLDGTLTLRCAPALGTQLRKLLLDRGRLLVDVSRFSAGTPGRLAVFPTSLAAAGGWPTARLVLFGSAALAVRMRRSGLAREVPCAVDRAGALDLLERRPRRVRRTTDLPATSEVAQFARAMVRLACEDWAIDPAIGERAVVVASELATNAAQHTSAASRLNLTQDRTGLRISVRDGSVRRPWSDPGDGSDTRLGLRVVERLSDQWGVIPQADGKTVWALFRPAGEERMSRVGGVP